MKLWDKYAFDVFVLVVRIADMASIKCHELYCTVLYCTVLYCTVLYCTVLYCTIVLASVQRYVNELWL